MATIREFLEQTGLRTTLNKIRFAGVVGKVTLVAVAFLGFLAIAVWKLSSEWMIFSAVVLAALVIGFVVQQVMHFAHQHPIEAMMEGAELVQYRQVELAAKNVGVFQMDPKAPPLPPPAQIPMLPPDTAQDEPEP